MKANKYTIKDPESAHGWPAGEDVIKKMLGLKIARLPDEGMEAQILQGVPVWVEPIKRLEGKKSSKHRVKCRCPGCQKVMSVGRLHQHVCKEQTYIDIPSSQVEIVEGV